MKKIKKLFWIFNILLISLLIFSKSLSNIDEVLQYNFGRYLANGYVLYKDFNCIVFPSFPFIMGAILKIFGQELIVYRVLEIFILVFIEIYAIKILKKLKLDNQFLTYIIITIYMVLISIFSLAEYNMLNCLILLIIINRELKENTKWYDDILVGVLVGLTITVKQSVGICILIGCILNTMIDKVTWKQKVKRIFFKILGVSFILCCMLGYLYGTNTIRDCMNYTILGLREFLPYFGVFLYGNFFIALLALVLIFVEIITIYKVAKEKEKSAIVLFIYGFASFAVMYPILDENHILIGFLPNIILYMYLFLKESRLNDKMMKNFSLTFVVGIIILLVLHIANFINLSSYKDNKHYQYIYMEDATKKELENITSFIKIHDNTYIIDTTGVFYMIPLDKFCGIFDLPNVGNTGEKGEQALIEKIDDIEEGYFLVQDFTKKNAAQNPINAINYVKENFEYIGNINHFQVYYKNR